jgi:putative inorganic carbon (HCO3(-)) transporter
MRTIARSITRWEWLILVLLIPLLLFPPRYGLFALLVIPLLWGARKLAAGHFTPPTPYDLALLLLLVMVGVSVWAAFDAALSIPRVALILLGVALFYGAVAQGRGGRGRVWPVVAFVLGAGTLMGLIGLVGVEWSPPFHFLNGARALLPRANVAVPGAVGGVVNPNELAGVLCWVAPLSLACLIGAARRRSRNEPLILLLAVTTLLAGFLVAATLSRGGMVALAAGSVLVVAFFVPFRWRLVLLVGFTVVLVGLIAYGASRLEQDIVGDMLGLGGRLEIWSRALLGISDFPLTGMGVSGFRQVIHVLYPLFVIEPDVDLGHAHNHLLQVALDLGLPGLIAYLALWFISVGLLASTARRLVRRRAARHPYYALVAGLAGSLLAGWLFGMVDTVALGARPTFLWWLLLGLTASVHYAVGYSGEWRRKT